MRFFHDITELWVEFMLFNLDQVVFSKKTFVDILLDTPIVIFLLKVFSNLVAKSKDAFLGFI